MTPEPLKVLLVEDNAGDARLIRLMLAEGDLPGYATTHVRYLGEAIKHISTAPPDAILLDLNLPDAHSFQTFARVSHEAPTIPVLLISGLDDQGLAIEIVRQGAQDYLIKGQFDANLLIHAIRYAIERKRSESRIQYLLKRQIAINRLAEALSRAPELAEIYRTVSLHLSKLLELDALLVSSYDNENQLIHAEFVFTRDGGIEDASWLPPIPLDLLGNSPQSQVILTGKALHIPDWEAVFPKASAIYSIKDDSESVRVSPERGDHPEINSAILAPMQIDERTVGVIQVQSYLLDAYSDEDVELFQALATVASLAVGNATLLRDLKQSHANLSVERSLLAQRVEEHTAELRAANVELARAARLKDEFLANMSHELRTPLNAILGLGQALQEEIYGPLNDEQMKALKSLEQSADHLLAVINDILDITKIEAGKVELDVSLVDVEAVCQAALQMVKTQAAKKDIQLHSAFDPLVPSVLGDARRLKQVLVNLLSNAVKFTPVGGNVGLEIVGQPAEDVVLFSVWDTGIGIPPDAINRLFRPFAQLDSTLARSHEGTGLGLVLVRRITELHGGQVSVESPVEGDVGSRFTVRLPWHSRYLDQVADELHTTTESEQSGENALACVGQVLLVEDDEASIEAFVPYLARIGHQMAVARNGHEAIAQAQALRPEAIIMDIMLPGLDGLEVIRRIRSDIDLAHIPIVVVSALVSPAEVARCRAAGANEYLGKPVPLRKLADVIASLLARSHPEHA